MAYLIQTTASTDIMYLLFRFPQVYVYEYWRVGCSHIQPWEMSGENDDWWQILIPLYPSHSWRVFSMVTLNYCTIMPSTQYLECHVALQHCPSSCVDWFWLLRLWIHTIECLSSVTGVFNLFPVEAVLTEGLWDQHGSVAKRVGFSV